MTWKKLAITLIYKLKLNTSVKIEQVLTSIVIFHYRFVRWWCKLQIHTVGGSQEFMWVSTRLSGKKRSTHGQLKWTHILI